MKSLLANIDVPFTFRERATPLPGDLRPAWRIGLVLLILLNSRGKKATLQKLHLLSSACQHRHIRVSLLRYLDGEAQKDEIIPRVDPSLNRALNLARAEGLVEIEGGKNIKLTDPVGSNQASALMKAGDFFAEEKPFLERCKSVVTETKVEELFSWDLLV
jgi:hypothetical protein